MTEEKILARVRKMLNLANDDGATEGERDNALRMANNLLTKYQMDMSDVDAFTREREDPRGHFQNDGWNMLWCKRVRMAIADLFMCKYYFGRKINATRGVHNFVGREAQATTAMLMSDWIIKSLLKEGVKRYGHNLAPGTRAFAEGAAAVLFQRVAELRKVAQEQVQATGSALVVVELAKSEAADNDAFIAAMGTTLKARKSRELKVDSGAYAAGSAYGRTINLNTQLDGKAAQKKAIN